MPSVTEVFEECVRAIRAGERIKRDSPKDKEFHFQNWFKARLMRLDTKFKESGRTRFPDFRLSGVPVAFEVKGLTDPGRWKDFDCNSEVPRGRDSGQEVYYVFGRYPKSGNGEDFSVLDLVICHGDFFNADHSYKHQNRSFRGFGSYGDILVRDRKMYVVPTPFALLDGVAGNRTLIVPATERVGGNLVSVGSDLSRYEEANWVGSYTFDMRSSKLDTKCVPNPGAGQPHTFQAYRVHDDSSEPVTLRQ